MDYGDQQYRRNEEWRLAWASLPADARAELERAMAQNAEYPVEKANGRVIHETANERASAEGRETVGRESDAVGMCEHRKEFAHMPDMAAAVDTVTDQLQEEFDLTRVQAVRIAAWHTAHVSTEVQRQIALLLLRIIGFFMLPGNLLIRAHALAHAARMATMNGFKSLRDSAGACGVSVEAIRKIAWKWVAMLGLPPLDGAKSTEARAKYSADKKTNHWRHQKCKPAPATAEPKK
jgi:hypothetical protein